MDETNELAHPALENGDCPRCASRWRASKINKATEPHRCPYQHEINNDDSLYCQCCEDCEQGCCDEI